uniref:Uncharacterized protein n=1 Tax=Euplotes crassus TaxID=5936 RepID=A0A7S3P0D3_EUPCR|mmetsp:Transcript_38601/g.38136  ORF Transcript_38601/g.38136 Transcript_38601/m.38136 type:complete len:145 (+) Transcript_38601:342-776(+)|eukprot:CAMPEP_0197012530 /NCGR_PEP_ID=MMETSP1380-20130617/62844_1 /TAXON_ID=5936 /ORGANISM="Euplotes crassus, Strain CT5" /LENGTH=144 /DNA_ID=CAMNT_0042436073 /DNA_START=342 /DNA_END=776 /DNA_ORIENTATION=+
MVSLCVVGLYNLSEKELNVVDGFLRYCITSNFSTFSLGMHTLKLDKLPDGMANAMKFTTGRVNLTSFEMTPYLFKQVVESCTQAKEIHFIGGSCETPPDDFELGTGGSSSIPKIHFHERTDEDTDAKELIKIDYTRYTKSPPEN